jgi:cell division protein FtsI (penicillin-binding protein 3)
LPGPKGRLVTLLVALALGFGLVVARLVDVQAVSAGRYAVVGVDQRVHSVALPAQRGAIVDRNGADLAVSVNKPTVWADPHLVTDPAGAARALAPVLKLDEGDIRQKLTSDSAFVYLARHVEDDVASQVTALHVDGVSILQEPTRVWPDGSLAASVLGGVDIDNAGLSGLEKQYDKDLAGKPGQLVVERDPSGHDIAGGIRQQRPSSPGRTLELTIDRDLQFFTEQALGEQITASKAKAGVAIVMDPASGEILAMANMLAGAKGGPAQSAGYNKSLIDVYEPGSVNKLVTISGAVQEGLIGPSDTLSVPDHVSVAGTTFQDAESHPTETWTPGDVMAQSSNAGAILIAQRLGKTNLDRYLRAFGLGGDTGLDFPGEASGIVPDLAHWSGTSLPTLAIGYGLAVTPLQMLEAYNTIADGGMYVAPSLVRSEVGADGKPRPRPAPARHRVVSEETASAVTGMLTAVVDEGTGTAAAVDGYTVAGKTGTARKAGGSTGYVEGAYVASFAGFLPADSPRLSAIVVLDEPAAQFGGLAAAPVFSQLASYAVRHYQVPADPPAHTPSAIPSPVAAAAAGQAAPTTLAPSSATRP